MRRGLYFICLTVIAAACSCSQRDEHAASDAAKTENAAVQTSSETELHGLPEFENSSVAKTWEIVQISDDPAAQSGGMPDKKTYVIARTDPAGRPMPAGNWGPSLHIGEEHTGNYSVSFNYRLPESGVLFFMMYDETDTVFANDYLGEEYYWYELLGSGRLDLCTTFGKNSKQLRDSGDAFISVSDYDPSVWNSCTLNVTDSGTELIINGRLVTVLDCMNDKTTGRLALDGPTGTMFGNFSFD